MESKLAFNWPLGGDAEDEVPSDDAILDDVEGGFVVCELNSLLLEPI